MERSDLFNRTIFHSLLILIALSSVPFGTVELRTKGFFLAAICLLALLRVGRSVFDKSFRFGEITLLIPPFALILLAVIQLLFTGANDSSENGFSVNLPKTLDFYGTKHFLITLAGLIITAEMLFFYTVSRARLFALIVLVIVTAQLSAAFGLLRIWWLEPSEIEFYLDPSIGFAQFVNRNHFMYLIEMAVGLIFGILLYPQQSELKKFGGWILTGILLVAAVNANSRGGLISLTVILLLGIFWYFFSVRYISGHRWKRERSFGKMSARKNVFRKFSAAALAVLIVFGGIVLTIAFVGGETSVVRFEKLDKEFDESEQKINRLAIWKATTDLIAAKPLTGSGLGAYSTAITRYDDTDGGRFKLMQAHNDYLELAAGGGLFAVIVLIIWFWLAAKRIALVFNSDDEWRRFVCAGAVLGLIGVLLHSFVDFGLRPFGNSLIFVVLVVIATAHLSNEKDKKRRRL